jgi:hypothetical protein
MRVSELLRSLSDLVANAETQQHNQPQTTEHEPEFGVMVPPLQQKIELMKKMAGEESMYDDQESCATCGSSPCECESGPSDDLDALKKNAGIVAIAADEDEPFEG